MESPKRLAEDSASQHPIIDDVSRGEDVKNGRSGNGAEHEEAADPKREGDEAKVPQREHSAHYNHGILMASPAPPSSGVAWQHWNTAAFARARDEHKPVLLSISTVWCRSCREMDRTSYANPEIAALINDRFVPIRVDADDRPDISERYSLGGWPTTAFLTPSGDILAGGTFVPAERMREVLRRVSEAFHSPVPRSPLPSHQHAPAIEPLDTAQLTARVFASFDEECGGFGGEPKFPHVAPLHLALDLFRDSHDSVLEHMIVLSLDRIGWGGLYDPVDGGFFRYATTRDWRLPHVEKLLDVNAALARLFLDAGSTLDLPRFTERAGDTLRYIQNWLADPVDGGWYGSQQADDFYYTADSSDVRRALPSPLVSRSLYVDSNAAMVSTALLAGIWFDDEGLRDFAVRSLERMLLACYKPGRGVAHQYDGQVRGLLADQVGMVAACLDAFELTDNVVYQMMAEELGHYALRTMFDENEGGFFDRAPENGEDPIGLLSQPLKPFVINCEAATALMRLGAASGDQNFVRAADRTIDAMRALAPAQGPLAAHWLLAVRAAATR